MMRNIIFVTGNKGKVATMQRHFDRLGVDTKVTQKTLELDEIQADTATEVALAKARQAHKILGTPILVDDSSFHIAVLRGFPGPYIKFMLSTVGIDGIIEFMQGKTDRSAYFLSSLVFIDNKGVEHIFSDQPYRGTIADKADRSPAVTTVWSDLYYIFRPDGSDKVLARMTREDHANIDRQQTNSYEDFCRWFESID